MYKRTLSRREFLRAAATIAAGSALGACAPQVVTESVKETVVVKETVIVEGEAEQIEVEKLVTATPAPKGHVTIELWQNWGGVIEEATQARCDYFNEKQSDITATQVAAGDLARVDGEGFIKFLTAAAAGEPPDLVTIVFVADPASRRIIQPIDALIEAFDFPKDQFPQVIWDSKVSWKGVTYGLPLSNPDPAPFVGFYPAPFEEAGVDIAKWKPDNDTRLTHADLWDIALNLSKRDAAGNVTFLAFEPVLALGAPNVALLGLWGNSFIDDIPPEGGEFDYQKDMYTLNRDEFVEAVEWCAQWIDEFGPDNLAAYASAAGDWFRLASKNCAAMMTGGWDPGWVHGTDEPFEPMYTWLPCVNGDRYHVNLGSWNIYFPTLSENQSEAMEFLMSFLDQESMDLYFTICGQFPAYFPWIETADFSIIPGMEEVGYMMSKGNYMPVGESIPVADEAMSFGTEAWDKIRLGQASVQEALDEWNAQANQAYDDWKERTAQA